MDSFLVGGSISVYMVKDLKFCFLAYSGIEVGR